MNQNIKLSATAVNVLLKKVEDIENSANQVEEDDSPYGGREKYNGSFAQDVEGYDDFTIDEAFNGDPDMYWNID